MNTIDKTVMGEITFSKIPRVDVVDALRGFAVMAILLIHSVEHFIYPVYPEKLLQPEWLNTLDLVIFNAVFSLIAGKGYSIFALLFGFTFYIQYTNQKNKGNDFGWRFLWRLMLLVVFATLNASFFPGGDVLLLFAITGLSLVVVRHMRDTTVLMLAIFFLLQPIELFHFIGNLITETYTLPNFGVGKLYKIVQEAVKSGDWSIFLVENITTGQKASIMWAIGAGRFVQTIGLFLLGLLLARRHLFVDSENNSAFWVRVLIVSALLFGLFYPLKVEWYDNAPTKNIKSSIGVVLDMWQKLCFTLVIVSSFVLAYYKGPLKKWTKSIRIYGRMSLTNYVTQSIIGALIFFPIGLNLSPYLGYTASLLIGVLVFVLQLNFSKAWSRKYQQGPLEKLWHKATWIGTK